jgi:hypothetical protein
LPQNFHEPGDHALQELVLLAADDVFDGANAVAFGAGVRLLIMPVGLAAAGATMMATPHKVANTEVSQARRMTNFLPDTLPPRTASLPIGRTPHGPSCGIAERDY